MKMFSNVLAAMTIVTLSCGTAALAELVENPAYATWAKHKVGTKVTLKSDVSMQGMNMTQEVTQTLAEITPDKAVVNVAMTMDMGGMKHQTTQKQEIAAKVEKGSEYLPQGAKGSFKELDKETIEVAGQKYECRVFEVNGDSAAGKMSGKSWHSEEIPGGLAKTDMKMEGAASGTAKMIVTSIEKK
jgi:hypothetical protein